MDTYKIKLIQNKISQSKVQINFLFTFMQKRDNFVFVSPVLGVHQMEARISSQSGKIIFIFVICIKISCLDAILQYGYSD